MRVTQAMNSESVTLFPMSVYYNLKSIEGLTVAAFSLGDSKREGQVVFLHLGHLTA